MNDDEKQKQKDEQLMALAEFGVAFRNVADAIDGVQNGDMPPEQVTTSLELIHGAIGEYLKAAKELEQAEAGQQARADQNVQDSIPPVLN